MSLGPIRDSSTVLKGVFAFSAQLRGCIAITDSYHLQIVVPKSFPKAIPKVTELGRKIPRDGKHHVNQDDNSLCLGSPLRLLGKIFEKPNLVGFAESCLVPYLYAISHKLQHGTFPFSELRHGEQGIVDDYLELFGLRKIEQVITAITLIGTKKRIANKKPCPCDCGLRLGKCRLHFKLNKYRTMTSRSRFKAYAKNIGGGI